MILQDINRRMEMLYRTFDSYEGIGIVTGITYEGDPVNFQFCQEDDKYARITTNRNFSEWMEWCTGDWQAAAPKIERLAAPYGVQWDSEEGKLFIRFRRNEMTLAQAVLRLQQAVAVVGALGSNEIP